MSTPAPPGSPPNTNLWTRWMRPLTPDDRGRLITPLYIDGMAYWDGSTKRLPAKLQRDLRRFINNPIGPALWWYPLSIGTLVVVAQLVLSNVLANNRALMTGSLIPIMVACGLGGLIFGFGVMVPVARRLYARRLVRAILAERCCPACAYALSGLATEADGCVVCPECSAAWRVPTPATPATNTNADPNNTPA